MGFLSYYRSSNMANTDLQTEAGKRQTWKISGYNIVSKTGRLTEIS